MTATYHHGQQVMVFDARGNHEFRGTIAGVHRCSPPIYDVQPQGSDRLAARKVGIPEGQIRPIPSPILAYERRESNPQHVKDEA